MDNALRADLTPEELEKILRKRDNLSLLPMSNFGYGGSAYLNKDLTQSTTVDIDINVNGSGQPDQVAYATYNVIKDELVALGLTSNVESVVT